MARLTASGWKWQLHRHHFEVLQTIHVAISQKVKYFACRWVAFFASEVPQRREEVLDAVPFVDYDL